MIPRETLKIIRKLRIRANLPVGETLPVFSFEPSAKIEWISRPVENTNYVDGIPFDRIVDAVRMVGKFGLARARKCQTKSVRKFQHHLEHFMDFNSKFVTQARALVVIPSHSVFKFQTCKRGKNYLPRHAFRLLRRSCSSSFTTSHGMPSSGCFRKSSARRSSSAICPGVSSSSKSPNSTSIASTSSRRSASGRRLICSNISDAPMHLRYQIPPEMQVSVDCLNSSIAPRKSQASS